MTRNSPVSAIICMTEDDVFRAAVLVRIREESVCLFSHDATHAARTKRCTVRYTLTHPTERVLIGMISNNGALWESTPK